MERYTQEQERVAVDHYLEHGRCNAHARRELGYPKSAQKLAEWIGELAPGERRTAEPRTLTASGKASAVETLAAREGAAQEVADEVGSTRCALYKWRRELAPEEEPPMPEPKRGAPSPTHDAGGARPAPVTQADIDALEAGKAELEEELRQLELRRDIMEGALEILGKGRGADPANELTNRGKTMLVESLRPTWRLSELLRALDMPRSSHQYQLSATAAGDRDAGARKLVCEVFGTNDGTYGRRRIHDELASRGHAIGERRIARIMAEEELVARGKAKPKRGYSSYAGEVSEHPGNRVRQDFATGLPNFLWLTDVTQSSMPAGKLCLSPALDCFDGAIASWTTSTSPNAEMANSMLRAALAKTSPGEREHLVIHSDCGCHYRWPEWISICDEAGITRSMPRKGCSPDNPGMEGFFGTMKCEMLHGRDWQGVSLEKLEEGINDYIERHNAHRIKRSLGGMSPLRFRETLGMAA